MPPIEPQFLIEKIAAGALIFQGLELLQIRRSFASDGIWRWATLRAEFQIFPQPVRGVLGLLLDYPGFLCCIAIQIVLAAAMLVLPSPVPAAIPIGLLICVVLTALRWRGTFNGGADYMTVLVLLMLSAMALFPGNAAVRLGCLWYLAVQTTLSYFISGAVKLKNADWRSGRALPLFMSGPPYDPPEFVSRMAKSPGLMLAGSWAVMLFELAAPLALLSPLACAIFLCVAAVFHVMNFVTFGLNRFIFAWGAAYPALYFCSGLRVW